MEHTTSTQLKATKMGYKIAKECSTSPCSTLIIQNYMPQMNLNYPHCWRPMPPTQLIKKMEFGIHKCASVIGKKGKITKPNNLNIEINKITLPTLNDSEIYKYREVNKLLRTTRNK